MARRKAAPRGVTGSKSKKARHPKKAAKAKKAPAAPKIRKSQKAQSAHRPGQAEQPKRARAKAAGRQRASTKQAGGKVRAPVAARAAKARRAKKAEQPAAVATVRRRATPLTEYWRKLKECGWLGEIPAQEHSGLRERLAAALADAPARAYQVLAVAALDPECIEGSGPEEICSYHSVLTQLADASFGSFSPVDVLDELDPSLQVARISFCLGDTSFHGEVPCHDETLQLGVIDLINRALEAGGVASRFQLLPADGPMLYLAFISDPVLHRARELGLIPQESTGGERVADNRN